MSTHIEILNRLLENKIVAIVRLDSGELLIEVTEALLAGGISVIEFTLTTPGALKAIEQTVTQFGERVLIGAGTVLDPETARAAILAGAEFIVTPTTNVETIKLCRRYGKPIMPGAMTPTEILTAWEAGADIVKVFPAGQLGGPSYLKAVLAPLPQVRMAPTGGVNAGNAAAYLDAGAVGVGVGGNLVSKDAVQNRDWPAITQEASRLVAALKKD
ncbi:MAG: bifunctional 4-hydroxy-2-oxoglutarate aldolase/2-dehydro-3-deoxy-phosphogluconate aldolase [Chloroflexota bacterium]